MVTIFLVYNAQWQEGVTRTCFKCLENIILRMKHVLHTALLIWLQLSLLSYQPLGRTDSDSQRTSVCTGFVWNQNKSSHWKMNSLFRILSILKSGPRVRIRILSFIFFCIENHGWRWHDLPSHLNSHDLPSHLNSQLARNMGVSLTLLKLIIDRSYYHRVKI